MARGAEARAAMVAGTDLRLAEAGVPNRPRHADISRSDLSQSLHSDPRCAKKELAAHLRTARRMRRPKSHNTKSGQGHIVDMVSIRALNPNIGWHGWHVRKVPSCGHAAALVLGSNVPTADTSVRSD